MTTDRRGFLRMIGVGAAAVVATPLLAKIPKPKPKTLDWDYLNNLYNGLTSGSSCMSAGFDPVSQETVWFRTERTKDGSLTTILERPKLEEQKQEMAEVEAHIVRCGWWGY